MRIFRVALLLVHAFVVSRLVSGAAVDRYESQRQQHTAVINLLDTTNDRRPEDEAHLERPTLEYSEENQDEEYYDYEDEDEDGMSGDYELEVPRVSMSSKPLDPSTILSTERAEHDRRSGKGKKKGKGKGKGKKRNPCLKKYKNFCVHGTCQYLRDLRTPSCICLPNYSGTRCSFVALPTQTQNQEGYSRTTALAVIAVVLSSLCLTIIGLLLALRFHKREVYDVENEEKVKLGLTPNH